MERDHVTEAVHILERWRDRQATTKQTVKALTKLGAPRVAECRDGISRNGWPRLFHHHSDNRLVDYFGGPDPDLTKLAAELLGKPGEMT